MGKQKAKKYEVAQIEYIKGITKTDGSVSYPSIRELAERHKVPDGSVARWATEGQWSVQRTKFQSELRQRALGDGLEKRLEDIKKMDNRCLSIAQLGLKITRAKMFIEDDDGKRVLNMRMDSRELEGLGRAAQQFQRVIRTSLGLDRRPEDIGADLGGATESNTISRDEIVKMIFSQKTTATKIIRTPASKSPGPGGNEGVSEEDVIDVPALAVSNDDDNEEDESADTE